MARSLTAKRSNPQPLHCVSILTAPEAEDAVADLLERSLGAAPSIWTDEAAWLSTVSVYCQALKRPVPELRRMLRTGLAKIAAAGLDISPARIGVRLLRPQDWAESWKRHFRPLDVGGALLIKPTWSRRRPAAGQAVVILDPGLSFGTGQHATTRFCLEQLVALRPSAVPCSFCDLGTGSGILAISAAKLGYAPVVADDYDADCVRIARENLELNEVADRVKLRRADVSRSSGGTGRVEHRADLVAANLMHDLLIKARDRILSRIQPKGVLILAGILDHQFAEVAAAYAHAGWRVDLERTEGEWRSGRLRSKGLSDL